MADETQTNGQSNGAAAEAPAELSVPEMPKDLTGEARTEFAIRRARMQAELDKHAAEKEAREAAEAEKAKAAGEEQKGAKPDDKDEEKKPKPGQPKAPNAKAWAAWNKDKENFNKKVESRIGELKNFEGALLQKEQELTQFAEAKKAMSDGDYRGAIEALAKAASVDPSELQLNYVKQKAGADPRTTKLEAEIAQLKKSLEDKQSKEEQQRQQWQRQQQEQGEIAAVQQALGNAGFAEPAKNGHFVQLVRATILDRKDQLDLINSDPELDGEALNQARLEFVGGIAQEVKQHLAQYWGSILGDASASVPAVNPAPSAVSAANPNQATVPAAKPVKPVAKPLTQEQAAEASGKPKNMTRDELIAFYAAEARRKNQQEDLQAELSRLTQS